MARPKQKAVEVVLSETQACQLRNLLVDTLAELYDKSGAIRRKSDRLRKFQAQPEGIRALLATSRLEMEVGNGGFKQYFWNVEDREMHQEARRGLKVIGAERHLAIFEAAEEVVRPHFAAMRKMQVNKDYFTKYKPLLAKHQADRKLSKQGDQFWEAKPTLAQMQLAYAALFPFMCSVKRFRPKPKVKASSA